MLVEWWLTDGEEPLLLPSTAGTNPMAPGALGSSALGAAQSLRCAFQICSKHKLTNRLNYLSSIGSISLSVATVSA